MIFPTVRNTDFGSTLVTTSRSSRFVKYALRITGCNGISVNGSGQIWSDLLYLEEIPHIVEYELFGFSTSCLKSFQGLEAQEDLKAISLDLISNCKIDWMHFPDLARIYTENAFINQSLWNCQKLERLTIATCGECDWKNISRLQNLNALSVIRGGMNDLEGLLINNLKSIEIHHNKTFKHLGHNQFLASLEDLVITNCGKFNSLAGIGQFPYLRKLVIEDCGILDSLLPVLALSQLEEIRFSGTKIADGKVRELLTMPSLKSMLFDDQPSQNISLEESLLALEVPRTDWPLMLREPKKWAKLTRYRH